MRHCHQCLAENYNWAKHCAECGTKLHVVGKSFSDEFHEKALIANRRVYGLVGGAIASGFYGLACAVLVPEIFSRKLYFFAGLLAVFFSARFCGRLLANALNDKSLS